MAIVSRTSRPASATRHLPLVLAASVIAVLLLAFSTQLAQAAPPAFGLDEFDGGALDADGQPATQAGGHPFEVRAVIEFPLTGPTMLLGGVVVGQSVKDMHVDLPVGFAGNPTTVARCTQTGLLGEGPEARCPDDSQVGTIQLRTGTLVPYALPVYNMAPAQGQAATFGFNAAGTLVYLNARVRPEDNGITIHAEDINQSVALNGATVAFWGVPQDPRHDIQRCNAPVQVSTLCDPDSYNPLGRPHAATLPARGLLSNPTSCSGAPVVTRLRADTWSRPGNVYEASFVSHDNATPPNPVVVTGCDRVPFTPGLAVSASSAEAAGPTGLTVELAFGQDGLLNPAGIAPGHLKDATVVLPEGMTINPASASGLEACADADAKTGSSEPVSCPNGSKIGRVTAVTPLLEDELTGGVYLLPQASHDPASGDMFRIVLNLVNEDRGIDIKLPGRIAADPATGRLTAMFRDNPQLPVSSVRVAFKDGPRAPVVNPAACGPQTVSAHLTSWSGQSRDVSSTFEVACAAGAGSFGPSFSAGSVSPVAGASSPFAVTVARESGSKELKAIRSVQLPQGLLGKVAAVPLCAEAQAAAGTCPEASRVGDVRVGAGAGSSPLWIPQPGRASTGVYLTGPYRGGPFGLSIKVPAQAGPFDLGTVVVRSALQIDPKDAHVTVLTDDMPTILEGVPLGVREVRLVMDRAGFMLNPTSCASKWIGATLVSKDDVVHRTGSTFRAVDCAVMPLSPVIAVSGGGKGNTKRFTHPSLKVTIKQSSAQAHLDKADVVLPKAFNVDLQAPSLKAACPREVYAQDKCSKTAIVGTVKAVTPIFAEPLTGPAFLLQKKGQLPDIVMRLQNVHYRIDLIGVLDFLSDSRVITRVKGIPDAPITSFELNIRGGRGGSLLNRSDLCAKRAATQATFKGQNGKVVVKTPVTRIAGCAAKTAATATRATSARAATSARVVHERAMRGRS